MADIPASTLEAHWAKTRNLTFIVLALWFLFSFVVHWFANALNGFTVPVLGFPLGFYMAAQGSLAAFVIIIFWLAKRQAAIDEEFGVSEE